MRCLIAILTLPINSYLFVYILKIISWFSVFLNFFLFIKPLFVIILCVFLENHLISILNTWVFLDSRVAVNRLFFIGLLLILILQIMLVLMLAECIDITYKAYSDVNVCRWGF